MGPKNWDVFISHASEDKASVGRPLFEALSNLGLRVWFDEAELKIGDSLSRSIDRGLASSPFGIVIISKNFLGKSWPEYEFRGLVAKSMAQSGNILPVWHDVSYDEVLSYSPSLADTYAIRADRPISEIALQILDVIKPAAKSAVLRRMATSHKNPNMTEYVADLKEIEQAPIRHANLPAHLIYRIIMIRHSLFTVYPDSLRKWIEGFQRDAYPTREIEVWEAIASRFIRSTEGRNFSKSIKRKIFDFLVFTTVYKKEHYESELSKFRTTELRAISEAFKMDQDLFVAQDDDAALFARSEGIAEAFSDDERSINDRYVHQLASKLVKRNSSHD